jgi:hypothetical protein
MPDHSDKLSLAEAIATCKELFVQETGFALIMGTSTIIKYTFAEIAELSFLLYEAVLAAKTSKSYTAYGNLQVARLCLSHWGNPSPMMAVVDSRMVYVDAVTSIRFVDDLKQSIRIETSSYDVLTLKGIENVAVPSLEQIYAVSFEWMDEYFPGSVARIRAASGLGLPDSEFLDYVLRNESADPVSLPPIIDLAP